MKKSYLILSLIVVSLTSCSSSDDSSDALVSGFAISYTVNGVTTNHEESQVTSQIYDTAYFPKISKNTYKIFTDEGVGFSF